MRHLTPYWQFGLFLTLADIHEPPLMVLSKYCFYVFSVEMAGMRQEVRRTVVKAGTKCVPVNSSALLGQNRPHRARPRPKHCARPRHYNCAQY